MKIAAHQPNYLPNLDYFSKMKQVDVFVVATSLKADRGDKWQMRHKIPTHNGDHWLTVPIHSTNNSLIKEIKICYDKDWQRSHFFTLKNVYARASGNKHLEYFEDIYLKRWERLADLNFEIIKRLKNILDIDTQIFMDEEISGIKHENFIAAAKKYRANTYVSGNGTRNYLTENAIDDMHKEGISHIFVNKYLGQKYPYSTIHYLLTNGKEWIKNVI